jgi:PhnB protein
MPVTPYLFFDGRCEEALEFYKKALGAEVGMMRFGGRSSRRPARSRPAATTRSCTRAFASTART